MNIDNLRNIYKKRPPILSFTGAEGKARHYNEWPDQETRVDGDTVWRYSFEAVAPVSADMNYGAIDLVLDTSEESLPDELFFPSNMQGNRLEVIMYINIFNCICMRTIGAYSLKT